MKAVAKTAALCGVTSGGLAVAHLLTLLAAAVWRSDHRPPPPRSDVKLAILVPAHDEEAQIAKALRSIQASDYPSSNRRLIVVADNCSDRTADVARAEGAEVWERLDPAHRGKGHALGWAFSRLLDDRSIEAVCVIDADCEASANLLRALAGRLHAGAEVVQASYLISNPDSSNAAALRWAGFALFNFIRPLGRDRLGLSSGVLGTGIAVSRGVLLSSPWRARSYAEDREQHMRWVLDGIRVEFAPEAEVRSPAPTAASGSRTQMARWDSGRAALAIRLTPRLLARSLRTGEMSALDAALEPVLLPQSLLIVTNIVTAVLARVAGARLVARFAALGVLGQVVYVFVGLAAVNTPPAVWPALLSVPRFVGGRMVQASAALCGRGPAEWARTERNA